MWGREEKEKDEKDMDEAYISISFLLEKKKDQQLPLSFLISWKILDGSVVAEDKQK